MTQYNNNNNNNNRKRCFSVYLRYVQISFQIHVKNQLSKQKPKHSNQVLYHVDGNYLSVNSKMPYRFHYLNQGIRPTNKQILLFQYSLIVCKSNYIPFQPVRTGFFEPLLDISSSDHSKYISVYFIQLISSKFTRRLVLLQ